MNSECNYSRNTILRSKNLIVKEAFYKGSLQRYEFYFYKSNSPLPVKQVFVQLDGKVEVI